MIDEYENYRLPSLGIHVSLCSNNQYSEDCSPNNDTDWDWGGGWASPGGSPGPREGGQGAAGLSRAMLEKEAETALSEWSSSCPSDYFNLYLSPCQDPIEITVALLSDPSYCKLTLIDLSR